MSRVCALSILADIVLKCKSRTFEPEFFMFFVSFAMWRYILLFIAALVWVLSDLLENKRVIVFTLQKLQSILEEMETLTVDELPYVYVHKSYKWSTFEESEHWAWDSQRETLKVNTSFYVHWWGVISIYCKLSFIRER